MALLTPGFRRFTEDIDILVTPEGLRRIHAKLSGLGHVPRFRNSRHLRDKQTGGRIEFPVMGRFTGVGSRS
ncbi:MAG: hypothetical protein AMXMBFR83_01630 [Phycisphaerae bacterium]